MLPLIYISASKQSLHLIALETFQQQTLLVHLQWKEVSSLLYLRWCDKKHPFILDNFSTLSIIIVSFRKMQNNSKSLGKTTNHQLTHICIYMHSEGTIHYHFPGCFCKCCIFLHATIYDGLEICLVLLNW